jgi:hypothetical protein
LKALYILSSLRSAKAKESWFTPRTGEYGSIGTVDCAEKVSFEPPFDAEGRDWVLVVDAI